VVPLPIARRANYPIRCSVKGSEQIDTVFRVADRSKEVSGTRYHEYKYIYTKDSTECKYSAAGRLGCATLLNFDTEWLRTTRSRSALANNHPQKGLLGLTLRGSLISHGAHRELRESRFSHDTQEIAYLAPKGACNHAMRDLCFAPTGER